MELTRFYVPFLSLFPGNKPHKLRMELNLTITLCLHFQQRRGFIFVRFYFKVKSQINIHCQAEDKYRQEYF